VPYNCPGCGGVLWKIDGAGEKRYRCHTGHSYSGLSLLASQSEKMRRCCGSRYECSKNGRIS
jgi:two-component system chemotaxis response regulator CheB